MTSTIAGQSTITTGAGNDTVTIRTIAGPSSLDTGAGADTISVGSLANLLDGIASTLQITAGNDAGVVDVLTLNDSGDTKNNTGRVTSTTVTGLGLGGTLTYLGVDDFTLLLGSGDDTLFVDSTTTGTSRFNLGAGADKLDLETTGGAVKIEGGAGDDTIRVNPIVDPVGTANGLGGRLTIDGGTGADTYFANLWGNGNTVIHIGDTGNDGANNTLTLQGTPVADTFLLRKDLVALLNTPVAGQFKFDERVEYDTAIKLLSISSLDGNDTFALDDNSAITNIDGGLGDDSFQIGQIFGSIISTEPPATVNTTRGLLTNGVSFATTIDGNKGNDYFGVFHNLAVLSLQGGDDDDTFLVRTFLDADKTTSILAGAGQDRITYTANAPVQIDGGAGNDLLIVLGTEADDIFVIAAGTIYGGGRLTDYVNIESLELDTLEGDDYVVIHSTLPSVSTAVYTGIGADRVVIGDRDPAFVPQTGTTNPTLPASERLRAADPGPAVRQRRHRRPRRHRRCRFPILLPGESATAAPPATINPGVTEADLVDTLTVDDRNGAAGTGTLTSTALTGLGMGATGIQFADFEALEIKLGPNADNFTIENTIPGRVFLQHGRGQRHRARQDDRRRDDDRDRRGRRHRDRAQRRRRAQLAGRAADALRRHRQRPRGARRRRRDGRQRRQHRAEDGHRPRHAHRRARRPSRRRSPSTPPPASTR